MKLKFYNNVCQLHWEHLSTKIYTKKIKLNNYTENSYVGKHNACRHALPKPMGANNDNPNTEMFLALILCQITVSYTISCMKQLTVPLDE